MRQDPYKPAFRGDARVQARTPTARHVPPYRAPVRGVVLRTYVDDSEGLPEQLQAPLGVYCDVLVYSSIPGMPVVPLSFVPVKQPFGGMHSGMIWRPRATTMDVSGLELRVDGGSNPANWDGDHVVVEWLEGSPTLPMITGALYHPQRDRGAGAAGKVRMVEGDGEPLGVKHRGVVVQVTDVGDVVVDAAAAHKGNFTSEGAEPAPNEADDTTGNVKLRVAQGSRVHLAVVAQVGQGGEQEVAVLDVEKGKLRLTLLNGTQELLMEPTGKLTLGNGALSAAIGERVKDYLDEHEAAAATFNGHLHTYVPPLAPFAAGAPVVTTGPAPQYQAPGNTARVVSGKVRFQTE